MSAQHSPIPLRLESPFLNHPSMFSAGLLPHTALSLCPGNRTLSALDPPPDPEPEPRRHHQEGGHTGGGGPVRQDSSRSLWGAAALAVATFVATSVATGGP